MRFGTLFFNKSVFIKNNKRFWPIWCAYILVWIMVLILPIISNNYARFGDDYWITGYTLSAGHIGGVIIGAFMGIASAMALWGFMYFPKSAGFTGALPIRRESLFITNLLSALCWTIGGNIIVFLLALGAEALGGRLEPFYLLQWLALSSMSGVFFCGFASFVAMLTGNLIVLPLLYGVLNFAVVAAELMVRQILNSFVYGMAGFSDAVLGFLSPPYTLLSDAGTGFENVVLSNGATLGDYYFSGWGIVGAYCTAGIVFAVLGLLLFRKHKMEAASDVVAIAPLRPLFRYCLAVGSSLVIGMLLYTIINRGMSGSGDLDCAVTMLIFMLIGCFIGYFSAEMLIRKSFRAFKGKWPGFLITCAIIIALIMALEFDLFGYERRVPDPDTASEISVSASGNSVSIKDPENIKALTELHGSIIENKEKYENRIDNYQYFGIYFQVSYTLHNGSKLERIYDLRFDESEINSGDSDYYALSRIINTREAIESRLKPHIPLIRENIREFYVDYYNNEFSYNTNTSFTVSEALDFYESCVLPDMEDGNIGQVWILQGKEYYEMAYACNISIYLGNGRAGETNTERMYVNIIPTVNSRRVNNWLQAHGIELVVAGEVYGELDIKY